MEKYIYLYTIHIQILNVFYFESEIVRHLFKLNDVLL